MPYVWTLYIHMILYMGTLGIVALYLGPQRIEVGIRQLCPSSMAFKGALCVCANHMTRESTSRSIGTLHTGRYIYIWALYTAPTYGALYMEPYL